VNGQTPSKERKERMSTPTVLENHIDATRPDWMDASISGLEAESALAQDDPSRARLRRGLRQVAEFWHADDGDSGVFEEFVRGNFARDAASLEAVFLRFERLLEQLDGHLHEIIREFRQQLDLDLGEILPMDEVFGGYDPSAHIVDDFFQNKLAFTVLLNFPLTTLAERMEQGPGWNRRQWAEVRLAQRFGKRTPAEVNLAISRAAAESDRYISTYNIWMDHVLNAKGNRIFPPKTRLLSHWNLRDELKAQYVDKEHGLERQRLIQTVMERIVLQTIPRVIIDNPAVDWNPFTNEVQSAEDQGGSTNLTSSVNNASENGTRFAEWLKTFRAARLADPYSPTAPTLIARRFEEDREIPEERVKQMLEEVLTAPVVTKIAALIRSRLGRPLEPFDIWYNGFRSSGQYTEAELDKMVAHRYTTPDSYQKDIPNLLSKLGFPPESAQALANSIVVDPARGAGHAMGAEMRSEKSHLRTQVPKSGMTYKGFNVAAHEMGHNVEQTISLNNLDYTLLKGVPNTAFTEAFAFLFQGHDLELLGLPAPDAKSEAFKILNDFWGTFEIAGVALVDMAAWHWMYDHPEATAPELQEAVIDIAKQIWNRFYSPVFGESDVVLLGIYSHMIDSFMYLPDYPIGHLISFQIEQQMKKAGNIGTEFERMAKVGRVTPDLWMQNATGNPVSAEALITAAEKALKEVTAD
jgi:hypothetical protein